MTSTITKFDDINAIRERHLKYIAEITKDLFPPRSEKLNREQQQWLKLRMRTPMGKPWKSWANRRSDF